MFTFCLGEAHFFRCAFHPCVCAVLEQYLQEVLQILIEVIFVTFYWRVIVAQGVVGGLSLVLLNTGPKTVDHIYQ